MFGCVSPVEEARAREIVDSLANNADLMGELRYWMSTMHVVLLIAKDRIKSAQTVKQLIAASLEARAAQEARASRTLFADPLARAGRWRIT